MKMKDSGVEWIGEIPEDWTVQKVKHQFDRKKGKPETEDYEILKLARSGIQIRDISSGDGQIAADYSGYNPVEPLDILINPMDLISGDNSNISEVSGVISQAYINLRFRTSINPYFYNYYFKLQYWLGAFFTHGKGVSFDNRWTINDETLRNFPLIVPSLNEQNKIVKFLDSKLSLIDQIIADTKRSIEELKAYKQSLITETVTKGLDPNVPMKDSDVEWIGEIPEGWSTSKIKYISSLRNEKGEFKKGDLFLTLDKMKSYKPGYEELDSGVDEGFHQIICKGDIVFSKLRPYLAKVAISDFNGFGTGELLVFRKVKIDSKFFMYKFISEQVLQPVNSSMYGTKMPRANSDFIMSLSITFPSLEEQKNIVCVLENKLDKIDILINDKQQAILDYESYKKSLIYEYVTGKKTL